MRARYSGRSLALPTGGSVAFEQPILDAIDTGSTLIVVLDQPRNGILSENVIGLDRGGRTLWQVQPQDLPGPSFYTGIAERGDGIWLIHYSGFTLRIEPSSGRVLAQQFAK